MTHGDDSGLVLPPHVAPYQVVIVPIPRGNWKETVLPKAEAIRDRARRRAGVRVKLDARDENSPGWKFAEWELRGVPLRLEIGPKDIEKAQVFSARRDTREKAADSDGRSRRRACRSCSRRSRPTCSRSARAFREEHTTRSGELGRVHERDGRPARASSSRPGAAARSARRQIKAETQATLRNIPLASPRVDGAVRQVQRRRRTSRPGSRRRT